jgi:hypothetical protein
MCSKKARVMIANIILLALVSALILTGCAAGSEKSTMLHVPEPCTKLWSMDIGRSDYVRSAGMYYATWVSGKVAMNMLIGPAGTVDDHYKSYPTAVAGNITYYVGKNPDTAWDATNSSGEWISGTSYSKMLAFEQNGLACILSGETGDKEVSLDLVSLQTAQNLIEGLTDRVPDCQQITEIWSVGFAKGNISVGISICPPPFAEKAYQETWIKSADCLLVTDGDLQYYTTKRENSPESPNFAVIAYLSDLGLIEIRGSVPWSKRNVVPRSELDFINIGLVQQVVQFLKSS